MLIIGSLLIPSFVFAQNQSVTNGVGGDNEEIDILTQKIAEKTVKIKQLEASIEEYKKKVDQKKLETVTLKNQISILDNKISQIELDIEATKEKLSSLEMEIEVLNIGILDKENQMSKQKIMLSELLRTIYHSDTKNYLEIAASYKSFADFYNRVQYLNSIEGDLGKSVKSYRLIKEDLAEKKQTAEERKLSYTDLQNRLLERKSDLRDQSGEKEYLLVQTKSSEAKFKTLLSSLKDQYQQIENEITAIEREKRRKLEALEKKNKISIEETGDFSWPTQSRHITAYFHDPDYPYRYVFEHNGIDIRAGQGTPIRASASGYVGRAKYCSSSSCYSYVMLIHNDAMATLYGHMSNIVVSEDQFVTRGDIIGYSGGTPGTVGAGPFVTGPHLHFEVRRDGIPVNPLNYLAK